MNTKENFVTKYFYYFKTLADLVCNRLLVVYLLLALYSIPGFIFFQLYKRINTLAKITITYPEGIIATYFSILLVACVITLTVRLILDTILSICFKMVFRAKNASLSKDTYRLALQNATEYDKVSACALILRGEVKLRKLIHILSYVLTIVALLICLKPLIIVIGYNYTITFIAIFQALLALSILAIIPELIGHFSIHVINKDYNRLLQMHMQTPTQYNSLIGVNFDRLSGIDFERFCATILYKNGYTQVTCTPASHDQGVDLTAYKNKTKYAIQCKCYKYAVGNSAVQEVVGGMKMYDCQKAMVITNSYYTPDAIKLAQVNNVDLIDRNSFLELLKSASLVPDNPNR